MCAANAVNKLNADAISLMGMEPSRDEAVAGAGMVVGVALLTMLMESVIIVLRFCTEGVWNAVVVGCYLTLLSPHFNHALQKQKGNFYLVRLLQLQAKYIKHASCKLRGHLQIKISP